MKILLILTRALIGQGFQASRSSLHFEEGQFVDTRDNHVYRTSKIGNQVWLAENFAYLSFICKSDSSKCGVWIYDFTGSDIVEAKKSIEYRTYGALYSWKMAIDFAPKVGICPATKSGKLLKNILVFLNQK